MNIPATPGDKVTVWWVSHYEGRTTLGNRAASGQTASTAFAATKTECCGEAAHYRAGELTFLACEDGPGTSVVLTCGRPNDPATKYVRSVEQAHTCNDLVATRHALDETTCRLGP